MTQQRGDRNNRTRGDRDRGRRASELEGQRRAANTEVPSREDQADSGPDRDHRITRQSRVRSGAKPRTR